MMERMRVGVTRGVVSGVTMTRGKVRREGGKRGMGGEGCIYHPHLLLRLVMQTGQIVCRGSSFRDGHRQRRHCTPSTAATVTQQAARERKREREQSSAACSSVEGSPVCPFFSASCWTSRWPSFRQSTNTASWSC